MTTYLQPQKPSIKLNHLFSVYTSTGLPIYNCKNHL